MKVFLQEGGRMRKDFLSESERLAKMTKNLRQTFTRWGYKEIFLPSVEEYCIGLRRGLKVTYNNEFFLVKPDITSQIAKHIKDSKELKLYYISEVLDGIEGTWQAGIEFIGGKRLENVIEVLSIVLSSLERLGIGDFYIDVGSLQVWEEATEGLESHKEKILEALRKRKLSLINSLPIQEDEKEKLWELLNFRGKESGRKKLDTLVKVLDDERVFIDLGTIRPFRALPYYNDLIFEVYSPKLGYQIGGGGEYSINNTSGVGFAFDLGALKEIHTGKTTNDQTQVRGSLGIAYKKARKLVKQGQSVEVCPISSEGGTQGESIK